MEKGKNLKVAVVADWMINRGGAEPVVYEICRAVREKTGEKPDFFTTILKKVNHPELLENVDKITTSWLDKIPGATKLWFFMMPFMFRVFEEFDLDKYDVVISSSHVAAKAVITRSDARHFCFCHSPTRYFWDSRLTFRTDSRMRGFRWIAGWVLHRLRPRDWFAAQMPDKFIANSKFIAGRIEKFYRRDSVVVYPPCDVESFEKYQKEIPDQVRDDKEGVRNDKNGAENYFFAMGRLVHYKKFDLLVDAFAKMQNESDIGQCRLLKIAGSGPELENLRKKAKNLKNVEILGRISDEEKYKMMSECLAFLWPQVEDFGITLVESQAAGRPAIALRAGAAVEIVMENETGVFFDEQSVESLCEAVKRCEKMKWDVKKIRGNAERFGGKRFREEICEVCFGD